jgi:hypothetical protein
METVIKILPRKKAYILMDLVMNSTFKEELTAMLLKFINSIKYKRKAYYLLIL